jgi:hypothetical protein
MEKEKIKIKDTNIFNTVGVCILKKPMVTISYVVIFINFINITLIYHITKQQVCETVSIIQMLRTCKQNLSVVYSKSG